MEVQSVNFTSETFQPGASSGVALPGDATAPPLTLPDLGLHLALAPQLRWEHGKQALSFMME